MNNAVVWTEFPEHTPAGWTVKGQIVARNTGTTTWTTAQGYKLAEWPPGTHAWTPSGRLELQGSVAPGQFAIWERTETMPQTYAGPYCWRMVREGVQFFGSVANCPMIPTPPIPLRTDGSQSGGIIINTGPFEGNRYLAPPKPPQPIHTRKYHWKNQTGAKLTIKRFYVWVGMDNQALADVGVIPYRDDDGFPIPGVLYQWDHYGEPNSPDAGRWFPCHQVFEDGASLTVAVTVTAFLDPRLNPETPFGAGAHVVVSIVFDHDAEGVEAVRAAQLPFDWSEVIRLGRHRFDLGPVNPVP